MTGSYIAEGSREVASPGTTAVSREVPHSDQDGIARSVQVRVDLRSGPLLGTAGTAEEAGQLDLQLAERRPVGHTASLRGAHCCASSQTRAGLLLGRRRPVSDLRTATEPPGSRGRFGDRHTRSPRDVHVRSMDVGVPAATLLP